VAGHYFGKFSIKMKKTKRALELEEAEARVSRLRQQVEQEKRRTSVYLQQELPYYLKNRFKSVASVSSDDAGISVHFTCEGVELRVAPRNGWVRKKSQILVWDAPFVTLYEDASFGELMAEPDVPRVDLQNFASVLADALHIAYNVIPEWRLRPPDAEGLWTTRVLRWISKQIGGQWPDIVAGHVVDKIQ
jgi:hypothetical protein